MIMEVNSRHELLVFRVGMYPTYYFFIFLFEDVKDIQGVVYLTAVIISLLLRKNYAISYYSVSLFWPSEKSDSFNQILKCIFVGF